MMDHGENIELKDELSEILVSFLQSNKNVISGLIKFSDELEKLVQAAKKEKM